MGKQARLKKERKAKREELRPQVEEWSKIPDEAMRGPCREPTCTLPHCVDPWVTVLELHNKHYDGPLIMLCYSLESSDGGIERLLRINGEDLIVVSKGKLFREDPVKYQAETTKLLELVGDRYGAGAALAVAQHLQRGAILNQRHTEIPKA